jgi:uncharacterized membrane protein (DUF485 family)
VHSPLPRASRPGLILFALYCVLYGGFVVLTALVPESAGWLIAEGLTLPVGYGVGLIVGALLLALLYAWICRNQRDEASP